MIQPLLHYEEVQEDGEFYDKFCGWILVHVGRVLLSARGKSDN